MTQPEIEFAIRDVEATLERHDIHLNTDDFNTLYDFIEAIATRIRENGQ